MAKVCKDCGAMKELEEFYRHPMMADGRLNSCKECKKAYARVGYRKGMEEYRWVEKERQRSRSKYHHALTAGKAWPKRSRDPVRGAANIILGNAVRDKRVVPAISCTRCGHDFSFWRREGHHHDYGKPLEVEWLCSRCHGNEHRQLHSEEAK